MDWPDWWSWDIELTPHLLKRMADRGFNEPDLRTMMEEAVGWQEDHEEGRYLIEARHDDRRWAVIVEPSALDERIVVVTAYPLE